LPNLRDGVSPKLHDGVGVSLLLLDSVGVSSELHDGVVLSPELHDGVVLLPELVALRMHACSQRAGANLPPCN
jgi:hypothetical protein